MTPSKSIPRAPTPVGELFERWSVELHREDARRASASAALWSALRERALLGPLREFLGRPSKMLRARVVEAGFRAAGGEVGAHPAELPLLVEALHAGSIIVDDIQDDSDERRGGAALHRLHGIPIALNDGNWLYFWSQVLLSRIALPDAARLCSHERLASCLLACHEGQAVDLTVRICDLPRSHVLDVVRALSGLKTAALLEFASALGAIAAGAETARVDAIAGFGRQVGVGLQMLDDLSGFCNPSRRHKAIEDLTLGRATWVWAWLAQELGDDPYGSFVGELRNVAGKRDAEPLVDSIRARIGELGLCSARRQLDAAVSDLRAAGGDDVLCQDFRLELARLERLYVER